MIETIRPSNFFPDYKGHLGDLRLERRAVALWNKLSIQPSSSIRQLSRTKAE